MTEIPRYRFDPTKSTTCRIPNPDRRGGEQVICVQRNNCPIDNIIRQNRDLTDVEIVEQMNRGAADLISLQDKSLVGKCTYDHGIPPGLRSVTGHVRLEPLS